MNHKNRILLVDDEISIIHSLKRVLDRDKYEIYSTTVPEEALEIINNTELDIILCDQKMTKVSGTEVLLYAKKVSPHTVRMLMTGYSDINAVASAINKGGIFYYFSKLWNNEEVIRKIDEAISYRNEQLEKEWTVKNYLLERNKWLQTKDQLELQLSANKEKMINSLLRAIKQKIWNCLSIPNGSPNTLCFWQTSWNYPVNKKRISNMQPFSMIWVKLP